jgi:hypothetical protein
LRMTARAWMYGCLPGKILSMISWIFQDMRRYVGTLGVLTFLSESSNAAYVDSFLGLCLQELDIIVQKSLNAETIVQGIFFFVIAMIVTALANRAIAKKTTKNSNDTSTSSCLPSATSLVITLPMSSRSLTSCGNSPLTCVSVFAKMVNIRKLLVPTS